jgi:hypothetical protein
MMTEVRTEELYCQIGDHYFDRPLKRGVKPRDCAECRDIREFPIEIVFEGDDDNGE